MKFLLDVCASSRSLQAFLGGKGHDAVSALAIDPKASDERLMAVALQDERVLVTEDIDVPIEREFSPFRICAGTAGRLRVPRIAVGGEETGQSASLESCSWAARLLLKNRPVARHFLVVGTSVAR